MNKATQKSISRYLKKTIVAAGLRKWMRSQREIAEMIMRREGISEGTN